MDHEAMRRMHGGKGMRFDKVTHKIGLISKSEIARETWLFRFEKPAGFHYRAGQHLRMSLLKPKMNDPAGPSRFWSLASAPFESDLAIAVRMRASPFKTELLDLRIGAKVQIDMLKDAPHGAFALDDSTTPVVFLAGGIGVVPAYSMVKQALHDGTPRRLTLLWSNRARADAPFFDELAQFAAEHDNFRFVPTLTGPDLPYAWAGEQGRISEAMIRRYVPDLDGPAFYISGLKGMVEDLNAALAEAGVPGSAIRSEEFGTFTTLIAPRKPRRLGLLSILGLSLVAVAALIAHLMPVWLMTNRHPLAWLKAHPVSAGAAGVIVLILAVKLGLVLMLRRRGRSLH